MRSHNFACALMSVAFRIELNGLISPSVPRLVRSCVKLMAVEGGEVCKQVGDERTSLRWLSYLAEQFLMQCSQQRQMGVGGLIYPESTQTWEVGPEARGRALHGLGGCLPLAGCWAHLAECTRSWGICEIR